MVLEAVERPVLEEFEVLAPLVPAAESMAAGETSSEQEGVESMTEPAAETVAAALESEILSWRACRWWQR